MGYFVLDFGWMLGWGIYYYIVIVLWLGEGGLVFEVEMFLFVYGDVVW